MGCCVSAIKPPPSPEFYRHSSKSSRAPPPVDEETVKEVLSETPNPKHFSKVEDEPRKSTPRQSLHKMQHQHNKDLVDINVSGEVSEIFSAMSDSISTTTVEEDVEVFRRRMTDRSPAKLRNRQKISGEMQTVKNSPVRGKQQSPGRLRSVSETNNSGSGFGSSGRQRPVPGNGQLCRSRSPADGVRGGARNRIAKSPSTRKRVNSPARVGSGLPDMVHKPTGMDREDYRWAGRWKR